MFDHAVLNIDQDTVFVHLMNLQLHGGLWLMQTDQKSFQVWKSIRKGRRWQITSSLVQRPRLIVFFEVELTEPTDGGGEVSSESDSHSPAASE